MIDRSLQALSFKNYAVNGEPTTETYYTPLLSTVVVDTINREVSFTPSEKLGQVEYDDFAHLG